MQDVFISYSSKDQKTADAIVNYLESNKIRCWIAYRDAEAGSAYASSIIKAIKESKIFLLVFSESSNSSKHVLREIDIACKYERIIIPFKVDTCQIDDAVEYYLSATHWLDAITAPMEQHFKRLIPLVARHLEKSGKYDVAKLDNTVLSNTPRYEETQIQDKSQVALKLISGVEVTEKDLKEALLLDSIVYDEIDDGHFTIEKCLAWHSINPDIYFMLKDEKIDAVVGYVNVAPVTEDCYNRIATGKIWDNTIDENSILSYDFPGLYHLNFTSIAVNPIYRNHGAVLQLMEAVINKLIELSQKGIYFKAMIADAVSPAGEKICRMVGMDVLTESNRGTKIYYVPFIPPKFKRTSKYLKTLAEAYEHIDINGIEAF